MYNVALGVDHDVAVVAVLHLENVLDQGVARQTDREVLQGAVGVAPEGALVDLEEALPGVLFEATEGDRVGEILDEPRSLREDYDVVGPHPQLDVGLSPDPTHEFNQLHGEELLSEVVAALDQISSNHVGLEIPVQRFLLDPVELHFPVLLEDGLLGIEVGGLGRGFV